jgi:uncharacterized membrane protein
VPEPVLNVLQLVARWLEITGATALLLGFVVATVRCIVQCVQRDRKLAMGEYRQALGRTVLIGLEVLVAATIIKTVTLEPTFEGISFLAIMVAIRTTLGWTMELEMDGRWPWQRPGTGTSKSA